MSAPARSIIQNRDANQLRNGVLTGNKYTTEGEGKLLEEGWLTPVRVADFSPWGGHVMGGAGTSCQQQPWPRCCNSCCNQLDPSGSDTTTCTFNLEGRRCWGRGLLIWDHMPTETQRSPFRSRRKTILALRWGQGFQQTDFLKAAATSATSAAVIQFTLQWSVWLKLFMQ